MTQIDLFQEESTSSHLDSLASRGASQASQKIFNRRKKTLATSGRGLLTLLHKKDPNIAFLKMFLTSQDWGGLTKSSLIWRIKITQRQHLIFQLTQVQERLTNENGSGSTQETWPTPTTMDSKEDSLKHATKMLQGKTHRSSGQPIQKTLSDKVMMEEIIKNPELMKIYQDYQMEERPYLPEQQEFVEYLRQNTTIKELVTKTDIKKTKVEHWFRKDKAGFSHPSIEDWEKIKPHLKTIKFDQEMTTLTSKEWTTKEQLWPTPRAVDGIVRHSKKWMKKRIDEKRDVDLTTAVKSGLWPTPDANMGNRGTQPIWKKNRPSGHHAQYTLNQAVRDKSQQTGQLDPNFVRWLMGYPQGWVDLENTKDGKKNPKE